MNLLQQVLLERGVGFVGARQARQWSSEFARDRFEEIVRLRTPAGIASPGAGSSTRSGTVDMPR